MLYVKSFNTNKFTIFDSLKCQSCPCKNVHKGLNYVLKFLSKTNPG